MSSRPKSQRVIRSTSSAVPAGSSRTSSLTALPDTQPQRAWSAFGKAYLTVIAVAILTFVFAMSAMILAAFLPAENAQQMIRALEVVAQVVEAISRSHR